MTEGMIPEGRPKRLKVLPQRFVLASLKQEQLAGCALPLLKLILYPENKERFFSFTDTSSEISLVLEEAALSLFQADTLQHTTQRWRAIMFDEGPLGLESTGIVNSVALPLSREEINIYYVSTYNSGFTLVEEDLIENAITCLKNVGFTFSNEHEYTFASKNGTQTGSRLSGNLSGSGQLAGLKSSMGSNKSSSSRTKEYSMVITKLPYQLYIVGLPKNSIGPLAEQLIKLFFFPDRTNRFFSYTETPDEVSVILDVNSAHLLPNADSCPIIWRALQISEGSYGSHGTETVSKFAKPLADARISIMNVSTYFNDYTLVEEHNMDKSLDELCKSLKVIIDEDEEEP